MDITAKRIFREGKMLVDNGTIAGILNIRSSLAIRGYPTGAASPSDRGVRTKNYTG
jgi:hypothetical protein